MLEFIDLIEQALHAIEHLSRAGIAAAAAADRAAYADADDASGGETPKLVGGLLDVS